jgi:hypothetical protein
MTVLVNLLNSIFEIIYNKDFLKLIMEDKKIKDKLDEQLKHENSGVSCDFCPLDTVIQKLFAIFRHKN